MALDPTVLQRLLARYAPPANSKTPLLDTLKRLTAPQKPAIRTITADPAQVMASPVVPPKNLPAFVNAPAVAPEFYVPPAPKRPTPNEIASQKFAKRDTLQPWKMPAQVSGGLPRIGQVEIPSLADFKKSVVPAISAMGAPIVSAGRVARDSFRPDVAGEGATAQDTLPQREREAFMGGVVQGGSLGYASPKQIVGAPDMSPEVQSAAEAGALLGSSGTNAALGYGSAALVRGALARAGVAGGRIVNDVLPAVAGRGPFVDALSRVLNVGGRVGGAATQGLFEGAVYGGAEGALRKPQEGETRLGNAVLGATEPTNLLLGTVLEPVMGGIKVDAPAPVRPAPAPADPRVNPLEQPRVREAQNIAGARNAEKAGMDTAQIPEARELRDMRIIDPAPGTGPLTVQRGSFGNIEDARHMLREVYTAEGQQAGIIETANGYRVVTRNNKAKEQLQLAGEPKERPMSLPRGVDITTGKALPKDVPDYWHPDDAQEGVTKVLGVNEAPPPAPIVKTKNVIQEDTGKLNQEEVIKDMEKQGFRRVEEPEDADVSKVDLLEDDPKTKVQGEFKNLYGENLSTEKLGYKIDQKMKRLGMTKQQLLDLDASLDGKIIKKIRNDELKYNVWLHDAEKKFLKKGSIDDTLFIAGEDRIREAIKDVTKKQLLRKGEADEIKEYNAPVGKLTQEQIRKFQNQFKNQTRSFDGDTEPPTELGMLPARPVEEPPSALRPMPEEQRKAIAEAFDKAVPESELLTEINPASIQRVAFQLRRLENMGIIPKGTADATVKYILQRKVSGAVLKKDIFAGKTLTKSSRSFQDPPTDSVTMIKDDRGFVALHELTHSASKNELENEIGKFFGNIEKRVNTRKKWARKYLENLGAGEFSLYGAGREDGRVGQELVAVIEQTLFTKAQEGKVDPFNVEPTLRAAIPEDAPPEVIAFFEETLIPEMTNVWENTSVNQDKGKFSEYSERKHRRMAPPKQESGDDFVRDVEKKLEEEGIVPSKDTSRDEITQLSKDAEAKALEAGGTMDEMFAVWDKNMPDDYRQQLGQDWSDLQNAKAGRRGASREGVQWSEKSTFPAWIPDNLRTRKAIDSFFEKFGREKIKPGGRDAQMLEALFYPAPPPSFFLEGGAVPSREGAKVLGMKRSGPRDVVAEMRADPYAKKLEKALGGPSPKMTMKRIEELKAEAQQRFKDDPEALQEFINNELPEIAKIAKGIPEYSAQSLGVRAIEGLSRKNVEKIITSQAMTRRGAGQELNVAKSDTDIAAKRAEDTSIRMQDIHDEMQTLDDTWATESKMSPDEYYTKRAELEGKLENLAKEYDRAVSEFMGDVDALAKKGQVSQQTLKQVKSQMRTDKVLAFARGNILSAVGARVRDLVTTKLNLELFGTMDIIGAQLGRVIRNRGEIQGMGDALSYILGPWKTAKARGGIKESMKDVKKLVAGGDRKRQMADILSGKDEGIDTAYFSTRDGNIEAALNQARKEGLDERSIALTAQKEGYLVELNPKTGKYVVLKPKRLMEWAIKAAAVPETAIKAKVQALAVHQIADDLAHQIMTASAKKQWKAFVLKQNVETLREKLIAEYYDSPRTFAEKYPMAVQFIKDQVDYYTFKQQLGPEIIANAWKKLTHRKIDVWESGKEPYSRDWAGKAGEIGNMLTQIIQPFFKIGVNITKQGITRTAPLNKARKALFTNIPKDGNADARAYAYAKKAESLGKTLTGIATSGLALTAVFAGDEDNPYYEFTGPYPTDQRKQKEWNAQGKREYAFILKFGKDNPKYWWQLDFRTFGQLNTPLKTWAAIRDRGENMPENASEIDKALKGATEIGASILTDAATFQFADKFLTAASRGDMDAVLSTVISQFATEFTPFSGTMKEVSRMTDEFQRDLTSGSATEKAKNIYKGLFGFIPSQGLQNLGGAPRMKKTEAGETIRKYTNDADWMTKVLIPFLTGWIVAPMTDATMTHKLAADGLDISPAKASLSHYLPGVEYKLSKDQEADFLDALRTATGNAVTLYYQNMENGNLPVTPSALSIYQREGVKDVTIQQISTMLQQQILDSMISDFRKAASEQWKEAHKKELTPYFSK